MTLTSEWRDRVDMWIGVLGNRLYRPLGEVKLAGFATSEQLTPAQARKARFRPMPAGTAWGAKWEYGWFRTRVTLPPEARGQRVILRLAASGAEGLVWVNGVETGGATNWPLREILLTPRARAGQRFDILAECYAGHGPTPCSSGPLPPGAVAVPEPPPAQQTVGASTFGLWDEAAYGLYIDVVTLRKLRDVLPAEALRVAEIDAGLRDFTTIVDLEAPGDQFARDVRAARTRLAPLLKAVNGSTAPTLFAFGHAHLDIEWLWPLAHTERKNAITFSNQLALIEQYAGYRFLASQAHLYWMLKNRYPALYKRTKAAARAGRIVADGGMWVEADTNVAGGEALIRQFVHGKRFFRDEFGVDSRLLWLPDVFGYSGALPQILRGCGVDYFATAKIFWNYHGGDPFPHNTFTWEGIDGTGVLVHLMNDYNSETHPGCTDARWRERVQKDGISTRLMPFGWGDGGGGPTRDHLEFVLRQKNLEGVPKVVLSTPQDYFDDLERRGVPAVRYVGELYYQCHRGTYTTQSRTKRGNRKGELALREAEMWSAAASTLAGWKFPAARMESAWRSLLLHQFHDILPGSSIHRVYEETQAAHAEILSQAGQVAADARKALARWHGHLAPATHGRDAPATKLAVTVFNSMNWQRTELVELPAGFAGACDAQGRALPVQRIGKSRFAEVAVGPCGWTTVHAPEDGYRRLAAKGTVPFSEDGKGDSPHAPACTVSAGGKTIENDLLRLRFDDRGAIASAFDKEAGRELSAGPCNNLRMYKDIPARYDAWDIDSNYRLMPQPLPDRAAFEVVSAGPLAAVVRVTRRLNQSDMVQTISLRRGSRRVDFHTVIDWREAHKMLKVDFTVDVHADEAIHEIQFGHLRRPTHASRPFDADRFEVANHKWSALAEEGRGAAVLNDCKYGLNVIGNTISLTLLRSPTAPDGLADQGRQEFTYAFHPWNGSFADCDVVRQAYELNCPATSAPGDAGSGSLLSVDAPNIVVEAVKPAEDGSGDVIVRLYEAKRTGTACTLTTSLPVKTARQADMLEDPGRSLKISGGKIALQFRAFEIKTIRLGL